MPVKLPHSHMLPNNFSATFKRSTPAGSPRIGHIYFLRQEEAGGQRVGIPTPALWAHTSRGVVPYLTICHVEELVDLKGVHIAFESYLENDPHALSSYPSGTPLHQFHGYDTNKHVVSLGLRDPTEIAELKPNSKDTVQVHTLRGSRKFDATIWGSLALRLNPDVIFSIPDVPATIGLVSQKRLSKSNERTLRWLNALIDSTKIMEDHRVIFAHLVGGANEAARSSFSASLIEVSENALHSPDQSVQGYVFDLTPIRLAFSDQNSTAIDRDILLRSVEIPQVQLEKLCEASLGSLSDAKPRILHGAASPHEILRLIDSAGFDCFDDYLCQQASHLGVAFTFCFPPPREKPGVAVLNLFDASYEMDFRPIGLSPIPTACSCPICIFNTGGTEESANNTSRASRHPFSRAYIHHLLHTHEMGAHTLLNLHNMTVLHLFFSDIRAFLSSERSNTFASEVARFQSVYDEGSFVGGSNVFITAKSHWVEVNQLRGKGRLKKSSTLS